MANHKKLFFLLICMIFSPILDATQTTPIQERRTYIIRVRAPHYLNSVEPQNLENWYKSFLPPTITDHDSNAPQLVYAYSHSMLGFAAKLTEDELTYIQQNNDFLASYPDERVPLLTTNTPKFIGLNFGNGLWNSSNMGRGVIIGVLDTGIMPGHSSFSDEGMPAPPKKWRGVCDFEGLSCNNKIIGARSFISGGTVRDREPVDTVGHGTHTASTAAGNFVSEANVLGAAKGTAAGIAPHAHLAIYQVCDGRDCGQADIIAAMDAAIKDGVDVISLSLGTSPRYFYNDIIAIGAFSAISKGIVVSCAGGNDGPKLQSITNVAPWILTVAAGTMNRNIRATINLGNGQKIYGETVFQPNVTFGMLPLVFPQSRGRITWSSNCYSSSLAEKVEGKIVLCLRDSGSRTQLGSVVKEAGAAAMILVNRELDGFTTLAEEHSLPASNINYVDGKKIMKYIRSTKKAVASITFEGTVIGVSPAPTIASFSSRGPSIVSSGILKPDITGPGVNVLAGWISETPQINSDYPFFILSGTSMSTPHISGVAALIKFAHPDWSPAAIKSAIMTTSDMLDDNGKRIKDHKFKPASFFDMGAGHVNPTRAADPGLVFDLDDNEYNAYLCGLGYKESEIEIVTHRKVNCEELKTIKQEELNYPAIAIQAMEMNRIQIKRTVTNIGEAKSMYNVQVEMVEGVTVKVTPKILQFKKLDEKKSFTVSLSWKSEIFPRAEGNLKLVSDKHVVRIPIVIFKN